MNNKELWRSLFRFTKEELRNRLAKHGVTRTKSLTKYQMIVKLYNLEREVEKNESNNIIRII